MQVVGNVAPEITADPVALAEFSDRYKATTNMDLEDFPDVLGVVRIDRV